METKTLFVERRAGEFRRVTLEKQGDGLRLFCHDVGETSKAMFGDADHEFWIDIPPDSLRELAWHLLSDRFEGRASAVDELRALCKERGIAHTFDIWA